jgi:NodT family efflux transporter outer membrane factor (OMF) lipoprotein
MFPSFSYYVSERLREEAPLCYRDRLTCGVARCRSLQYCGRLSLVSASWCYARLAPLDPTTSAPNHRKPTSIPSRPLPASTPASDTVAGAAQAFVAGAPVPAGWWTLYGCAALDALVQQAFKANPTVQSAQAALRQAHETLLADWGVLAPSIDASASGTRQRLSGAQFGPESPSFVYNLFNASVNVSYAIDIWGGARRELEALRAQRDYERYALQGTYLTLASNVVTTAITEASLRAQIETTERLVEASGHRLEVIKKQQRLGGASSAEVLAQQAELAQDRTTLPGLRDQLHKQRSLLATLLGRIPSDQPDVQFQLTDLHLPESVPLSLPSQLVIQRPDVRQQEELLHQASAKIGVATANMLPQISLSASLGGSSITSGTLFQAANRTWSVGASVAQPLFHGGQLLHQRRAAIAAYDQAVAEYRETVLTAFRNVADSLQSLSDDADTLTEQSAAEQTAAASLALTDRQYTLGAVSFLTLLNAQRTESQAHVLLIQAQAARLADTAALFQALGGGWQNGDAQPGANQGESK